MARNLPQIDEGWNGPGDRDGVLTAVTEKDNALHPNADRWAFEHWYYDAHLDSGHTVVAFLQKRRPEEPPWSKPVVELLIYYPDGTRRQITKHHPKDAFSASAERCEVRIGESHAHSDWSGALPVHHLHAEADGVAFDLTFTNETAPWMPGGGLSQIDAKSTFGWVIPGPRAQVAGTITLDGETTTVSGRGYHDHNWGQGNMPRIIERWHWGRLYTDEFSLLFANVMLQKRFGFHTSRPTMLARGKDILLSTGEMTLTEGPMQYSDVAHRTYPEWIELVVEPSVETDPAVRLRLDVQNVIHAHDLLDDAPIPGKKLLKPLLRKMVGQPGYFRFDSKFELNVAIDGTLHTQTGRTLHEMVALH